MKQSAAQSNVAKITLLSSERSKNIELVLGKLKLPNTLIIKILKSFDVQILTPAIIESLDGICPTEEEVKCLAEYTGEKDQLGNSELFVDALRTVNGFQHRLKAIKFKIGFQEQVVDLKKKIAILDQSFLRVREMPEIETLLRQYQKLVIFKCIYKQRQCARLQNRYNRKCADMKTSDAQENLLYYVIDLSESILKKEIIDEQIIQSLEPIEKLSISQLQVDLSDFKKGQMLQQKQQNIKQKTKRIKLEHFYSQYRKKLKQISLLQNNNQRNWRIITKSAAYFCENQKIHLKSLEKNTQDAQMLIENKRKRFKRRKEKSNQNCFQNNNQKQWHNLVQKQNLNSCQPNLQHLHLQEILIKALQM